MYINYIQKCEKIFIYIQSIIYNNNNNKQIKSLIDTFYKHFEECIKNRTIKSNYVLKMFIIIIYMIKQSNKVYSNINTIMSIEMMIIILKYCGNNNNRSHWINGIIIFIIEIHNDLSYTLVVNVMLNYYKSNQLLNFNELLMNNMFNELLNFLNRINLYSCITL